MDRSLQSYISIDSDLVDEWVTAYFQRVPYGVRDKGHRREGILEIRGVYSKESEVVFAVVFTTLVLVQNGQHAALSETSVGGNFCPCHQCHGGKSRGPT